MLVFIVLAIVVEGSGGSHRAFDSMILRFAQDVLLATSGSSS